MDGGRIEVDEEIIYKLWRSVLREANRLIETHDRFGFGLFKANMNPALSDMLQSLNLVEFVLSVLAEHVEMPHDQARDMLNAKQCVLHMKSLMLALEADDEDAYTRLIRLLQDQSQL